MKIKLPRTELIAFRVEKTLKNKLTADCKEQNISPGALIRYLVDSSYGFGQNVIEELAKESRRLDAEIKEGIAFVSSQIIMYEQTLKAKEILGKANIKYEDIRKAYEELKTGKDTEKVINGESIPLPVNMKS